MQLLCGSLRSHTQFSGQSCSCCARRVQRRISTCTARKLTHPGVTVVYMRHTPKLRSEEFLRQFRAELVGEGNTTLGGTSSVVSAAPVATTQNNDVANASFGVDAVAAIPTDAQLVLVGEGLNQHIGKW